LTETNTQFLVAAILRHLSTNVDVCFMALHLKSGYADTENLRIRQFKNAMDWIHQKVTPSMPIVVAGDMNSDRLDTYAQLANIAVQRHNLIDVGAKFAPNKPTYNHWHPSVFDYVFVQGLDAKSYYVPETGGLTPNAYNGSDHLPVSATLALRLKRAGVPTFDDVLSIYANSLSGFFQDAEHRQFVRDNFEADTATLITLPGTSAEALEQHLKYRVPVYFGYTVTTAFDDARLKQVLGYSATSCEQHWDAQQDEPQYAIVGPVKMMNDRSNVAVIHTWGVNLESSATHDYKKYVNDGFKTTLYQERYKDMFRLIVRAAQHVAGSKRARVRCPLIGMGAFLTALDDSNRTEALKCFANAANDVLESTTLHWTFCIFPDPEHFPVPSKHPLVKMLKGTKRITQSIDTLEDGVRIGLGDNRDDVGNLMKLPDFDPNIIDVVVNAWDNRSFVGNGGKNDRTIDGFVVANAGGFNNDFRNTSYLHNFFFNPSMRDPLNWKPVEQYLCPKSM